MASQPNRNAPRPQRPTPPASREPEGAPRLPHERDESADSQRSQAEANVPGQEVGEQALRDVRAGRVDTDRGPVMDRLYRRNLRRSGPKDRR
jgi:hypothetical protein